MTPVARACCVSLCAFAWLEAAVLASPERSVSTSRQFLVYGADFRLRGAICDLAERAKRDLLRLIDQRDEWVTPIVINAQFPQANWPERPRAVLVFSQTGFGLKLQLDLTITADENQSEVRHELLRAILLEMMYRHKTDLPAGTAYVPPPDWLLAGIPPAQEGGDPRKWVDLLRAPDSARNVPRLTEILGQRFDQLDETGRSLYGAYSLALVEFLAGTPETRARLARFVAELSSTSNDPMADLGRHFPTLAKATAAEEAWRIRLAELTAAESFQWLSADEANRKMDEILVLELAEAGTVKKYRLEDFPKFVRNPAAKAALARCSRELSVLATRANLFYRPIISEYARIAMLLGRGKTGGIAARLARLDLSRKRIAVRMREIDDYLNWFEATKPLKVSGAFANYLKAAEEADQSGPRRRDAISVYVDILEAQFQD